MLKRVMVICMAVMMVMIITSCGIGGDTSSKIKINYGKSDVYTRSEMDEAIGKIELEFEQFSGARITEISYYGDEGAGENMVDWANFYRSEDVSGEDSYVSCIGFRVKFHADEAISDLNVSEGTDNEYEWWLAKTDNDVWEIWGYGPNYVKDIITM